MSRGVRSISDLVNGLRNNKMIVHYATLRSNANVAFITASNLYTLPFHLLKNAV